MIKSHKSGSPACEVAPRLSPALVRYGAATAGVGDVRDATLHQGGDRQGAGIHAEGGVNVHGNLRPSARPSSEFADPMGASMLDRNSPRSNRLTRGTVSFI